MAWSIHEEITLLVAKILLNPDKTAIMTLTCITHHFCKEITLFLHEELNNRCALDTEH